MVSIVFQTSVLALEDLATAGKSTHNRARVLVFLPLVPSVVALAKSPTEVTTATWLLTVYDIRYRAR